jgi:hypothetical protein
MFNFTIIRSQDIDDDEYCVHPQGAEKMLLHSGSPGGIRNLQTSRDRSRVRTRYCVRNLNGKERIMAAGKFSFWGRNARYDRNRYDWNRYDRNDRYDCSRYHR